MDHHMEPPSSQAIDEDNQEAIINANVAELESQYEDYNNETLTATPVKANDNRPQPSAPKKRKTTTSTGTRGGKQPASNKSSNLLMMMLKKKMSSSSLPL